MEAHLKRYEQQEGKSLCVPFSKVDIINFIGFLLSSELNGATIQSYISSVRVLGYDLIELGWCRYALACVDRLMCW